MSRSRKKHGVSKDRGERRADYNRRFRRVNRQRVHMGKDPYQMRELVNPYDVCDWKSHWDWDKWVNGHCSSEWKKMMIEQPEVCRRHYFGK